MVAPRGGRPASLVTAGIRHPVVASSTTLVTRFARKGDAPGVPGDNAEMSKGLRVRTGAAVGALALAAGVVCAPLAAGDPAPPVPSQSDVTKAQEKVDATAKEVAALQAEVAKAGARLQELQRSVAAGVAAQEKADTALADAEAAMDQALADLAAARVTLRNADSSLSAAAAQMYMQGGDLQDMTTLVLSPPGVMSDLSVVLDQNAHQVRDDLDAASAAANEAAAQEGKLTAARDDRDLAAQRASVELAAIKASAAKASAEATRLGAQQEKLTARLDELQQGVSDLAARRLAAARQGQFALLGLQAPDGAPRVAQDIARSMMSSRGWDGAQFTCLVSLWNAESGWSWSATNPSSGAYGIPQALPGWKMASAGDDWLTNPKTQISWGMGYIASTYGSPCNAWDKFLSRSPHWY